MEGLNVTDQTKHAAPPAPDESRPSRSAGEDGRSMPPPSGSEEARRPRDIAAARAAPPPSGSMADAVARTAPTSTDRTYKWKVLASVIFGIFMIILDSTVVNVAFPTLRREFGASLTDAQWIISVYVLALGIATPLSGFLADRFGMKRLYLTGLAGFVLGSLLCALAPNLTALVAARALQGFGGGLAQPLGSAFIFSTFKPREQGLALGLFGIALVVAPALGPILGGELVDLDRWRWIFLINVPIGIGGVALATWWLPERRAPHRPRVDALGVLTAIVGFGAVLYAASRAADTGWTAPAVLASFISGLAALALFTIVELWVAPEPLLNLRLFANPVFTTASAIGYVTVIGLFGAEFLMPLYLQVLRGRTALETGVMLLPLALAAGIATPLAGRLYDRIGPRPLAVAGFALLMLNTWLLSLLQAGTSIAWILVLLTMRGLALGLTVQTTFTIALASVPLPQLARGSSLISGSRLLVQSIGVAVLATVLVSAQSPNTRLAAQAAQETAPGASIRFGLCETPGVQADQNLPPALLDQLGRLPPPAQAAARTAALQEIRQACAESVAGFERAYRLTFVLALIATALSALLPGWPGAWEGRSLHRAPE